MELKLISIDCFNEVFDLYLEANWMMNNEEDKHRTKGILIDTFAFCGAFNDDQLIGMGRLISDKHSDAYIQDVYVKPAFRGKNVGQSIINFLVSICNEKKIDWVGLIAEPGTTSFYEKLGFKELNAYKPMLLVNK